MIEERLKILSSELGFKPWQLVVQGLESGQPRVLELMGYPYEEKEQIIIKARTEVGEPTSMLPIPVIDLTTMRMVLDNLQEVVLNENFVNRQFELRERFNRLNQFIALTGCYFNVGT